jgi:hypothetical protein
MSHAAWRDRDWICTIPQNVAFLRCFEPRITPMTRAQDKNQLLKQRRRNLLGMATSSCRSIVKRRLRMEFVRIICAIRE